jgi:intraflagellar transport protein 172
LKAGLPAKAASIVSRAPTQHRHDVIEKIATALTSANMHTNAGEFFEKTDQLPRALECYIKGNEFKKACELARRQFPGQVVRLEEQWGDYLVSQKRVDQAITHFIEAGQHRKAIEAALNSRQWDKAQRLVEDTLRNADHALPYYRQIANHYHECKIYEKAEKLYIKAGMPQEAVEMYTKAGR